MADQLEHVEETSERRGDGYVNLALLTDGLRAEREQGITIDVAYRSFVTPTRRFQLADAPGHVQYTRNMVTGASTADVAVVLLDARKGVIEQTRRHTFIAATLGIPHIVFAVNKMDLVDFDEARFREIERSCATSPSGSACATRSRSRSRRSPATTSSSRRSGCPGGTAGRSSSGSRRSRSRATATRRTAASRCSGWSGRCRDEHHDYRGYAGQVAGGEWRAGDEVVVLPSGLAHDGRVGRDARRPARRRRAGPVGRRPARGRRRRRRAGDMLCDPADPPVAARELEATVCWMSERPVADGRAARRQAHDALVARDPRRGGLGARRRRRSSRCRRTASG